MGDRPLLYRLPRPRSRLPRQGQNACATRAEGEASAALRTSAMILTCALSCSHLRKSAHRFLHERSDLRLHISSQLLQREGGCPHSSFIKIGAILEAEGRVSGI